MHLTAERRHGALLLTCLGCYDAREIADEDPLVLSFLSFESAHSDCDPRPAGPAGV